MSIVQAIQEKLRKVKDIFRPRIHSLGINNVQSQLTAHTLMLLSIYEACKDSGVTFNFNEHQLELIQKAVAFREIKEESAHIKEKVREAKKQEDLDAIIL